ncbi:MAG: hypothetical protein M1824_000825 [Vezdaea acicularis]|nr:MAG: hypothetical protein M1824_000825 [Vezdaea acicularis]
MTLAASIMPRWIILDIEGSAGTHIHYTYGLTKRCTASGLCEKFPQQNDCFGTERQFCSMWRSTAFLQSFTVVLEGMILVTFITLLVGGKQKRDEGWKVLSSLLFLAGLAQCAGMALVTYIYDYDEAHFLIGCHLGISWVICTISWCILIVAAIGVAISAYLLPQEGGYELIPDREYYDSQEL